MVVGIHVYPAGLSDNVVYLTIRQLLNCAVPIFFAVSGYFIAKKELTSFASAKSFWRRQIPTVYLPCLIFSILWFALTRGFSRLEELPYNLFKLLFCGYSVYYFIAVIIQLYLLTPLLMYCHRRRPKLTLGVSAVISFLYVTLLSQALYVHGLKIDLILYAGPCFLWIFFYMLGIYLSDRSDKMPLSYSLIIAVAGLILSVYESKFYLTHYTGGAGIKLSSFVFSTGVVLSLFNPKVISAYKRNFITRIFLWLGEISLGIYFVHMLVHFGLGMMSYKHNWFLDWALLILISTIVIVLSKLILPKDVNRKYFGFR